MSDGLPGLSDVSIEALSHETEAYVQDLIRRNLHGYEEAGTVLAATFRRLPQLMTVYAAEGAQFFVLRDQKTGGVIGAAGLGSLHGLPVSEGLGEVRDLVLEQAYRGRGYGARLLKRCVEAAKKLGYHRLYLETTPQMEKAQKLFIRFGFRPITQAQAALRGADVVPGYFILDKL